MTGDTLGVPGLLMFSATPDDAATATLKAMTDRSAHSDRGAVGAAGSSPAAAERPRIAATRCRRWTAVRRRPGVGRRTVRPRRLPRGVERHRGAADLLAPGAHDQPADARVVGGPCRRPGAASRRRRGPGQEKSVDDLMTRHRRAKSSTTCSSSTRPRCPTPFAADPASRERMSASGPRDRQGRSLYELDLQRRLLKYPCSYLIYSPAFDALPPLAKAPIYRRLWQVLVGRGARAALPVAVARGSARDRRDPEGHQARSACLLHHRDAVMPPPADAACHAARLTRSSAPAAGPAVRRAGPE